jgi:hypothetical protein
MTLDEIQKLWEEDSIIDPDNLHTESIKIPQLHSKYHNFYNNVVLLKMQAENNYKIIRKEKWMYYTGKADIETYKENPFNYKVLKGDIDKYMDADEEIIKAFSKINYYETMLNYLDSILKIIVNRTYQIKNSIEFMRFSSGLG